MRTKAKAAPALPVAVPPEVMAEIDRAAREFARVLKAEQPDRTERQTAEDVERYKAQQVEAYTAVPAHVMVEIEKAAAATHEARQSLERDRAAVLHDQRMKLVFKCLKFLEQRRRMLLQADRLLVAKWPIVKGELVFDPQGDRIKMLWRFERPGVLVVSGKNSGNLLAQSMPARLTELDLMAPLAGLV